MNALSPARAAEVELWGRAARRDGRPFNSWPLGLGILEVLRWYAGWCEEDVIAQAHHKA